MEFLFISPPASELCSIQWVEPTLYNIIQHYTIAEQVLSEVVLFITVMEL